MLHGSTTNILVGAIVGGPDHNDNFANARDNYEQTELATYNNGPMVGILARLQGGNAGDNQLLPRIIVLQDEINLVLVCFSDVDGDAFNGCSSGSDCAKAWIRFRIFCSNYSSKAKAKALSCT